MNNQDSEYEPEDLTVDWPGGQQTPPLAAQGDERTTMLPKTPPPMRPAPPPTGHIPPRPSAPYAPPPPPAPYPSATPNPYAPQPQPSTATSSPWHTTAAGGPPPIPPGGFPPAPIPPLPDAIPSGKGGWRRWGVALVAVAVVAVLAIGGTWWVMGRNTDNTATASDAPATSQSSAAPTTTGSATPTSSTPTTTSSSPTATTIAAAAVPNLLLSPEDVSTRMQSPGMIPGELTKEPANGVNVSPPGCTGVFTPAHASVYGSSGYTSFAAQTVNDPDNGIHKVIQMVAAFPSDQAAQDFYSKQVAAWMECKNQAVTAQSPGSSDTTSASVGAVVEDEGILQTIVVPDGSPSRICGRNLTARANIVIDVRACAENPGGAAWSMVRDIGEKITGQR